MNRTLTAAVVALAVLTGCTTPEPTAASGGHPTTSERVTISVTVITSSGLIGQNHDDVSCVYRELRYELSDESGRLIAVRQVSDQGVTAGNAEWAALGSVGREEPYVCSLAWSFDADPAEFYQLRVTATGAFGTAHEAETSFDASRAVASGSGNPIELELG